MSPSKELFVKPPHAKRPSSTPRRASTPPARQYEPAGADELCTVEFAADLLKVHPRTIHRYIHEGLLLARRIGKAYRIRRGDLAALAGLPDPPPAPTAALTAFLDVADVGAEAAKLWKRTVATAIASRGPTAPKAEVIYEAELRQLKVVVVGAPGAVMALLAQAQAWLENIRN
jgi:excisionase family DNA binding protein